MTRNEAIDHHRFLKGIKFLLLAVLTIKLASYFTWSENIVITRVVKLFSRVMMTAAIIWVYQLIIRRGAVASFKWSNPLSPLLYGAYLALGLVSFFWSTSVGYSALQWFMDFESLVFAYYFIACFILLNQFFEGNTIKFYNIAGNAIMLIMSVFLIGMLVNPFLFYRMTHGGEEARLGGLFMNPNELGMLSAVGVSCSIFDLYRKGNKLWPIIKIALLMLVIILTGSRSTTVGCLLIAFFHINQSSNRRLKTIMYASTILIIPLAIQKMMIKDNGGGMDEVLSMTGRLPFWKALITEGLPKESFFGYGFMRIAYKDYFQSVHTYSGQMTHNTFIQVLMNLGFVGFTLVVFQLVFTFRGFFKTKDKEKRLMLLGIIIPVMINSFTEFGIFGETNYGILFYQLLIFYISIQYNPLLTPLEKMYLQRRRPELVGLVR